MEVERVDFLSSASQDIERSRRFHLETLGLPLDRDVPTGGFEATCGQVTLAVWEPETIGLPFAPNPNDVAMRVADVEETRAELEAKGIEFAALTLHRRYAP